MRVVYKYELSPLTCLDVELPMNYKVVKVGEIENRFFIWIEQELDAGADLLVKFSIVGTGQLIPNRFGNHVGTILATGGFVWHVYEG